MTDISFIRTLILGGETIKNPSHQTRVIKGF